MMIDGELVDDEKIIKEHIQDFCQDLFGKNEEWRSTWEDEDLGFLMKRKSVCIDLLY